MSKRTFKELFCDRIGCASENYEREALRHCLYPRALPFLWILQLFDAQQLRLASAVLEEAGKATTSDEFSEVVHDYRIHIADSRFIWDSRFRLSSTRLLAWIWLFEDVRAANLVFDTEIATKKMMPVLSATATEPADA